MQVRYISNVREHYSFVYTILYCTCHILMLSLLNRIQPGTVPRINKERSPLFYMVSNIYMS